MKNLEITAHGLKCDAPGCCYRRNDVNMKDYKKWIDVPCPRCGAPLLTKADALAMKRLLRFTRIVNLIPQFIIRRIDSRIFESKIRMRGDGSITVTDIKEVSE